MKIGFRDILIFLVFLIAGILMLFHPTIFSGFGKIQTDLGDTRLVNYFLEHSYQHAIKSFASDFWSPLYFFPEQNVAAYSEVMIGAGPFYWIFRVFGFAPDTSFQLWMIEMSILNFIVFAMFLKSVFKVKTIPAAVGAFLFAFGAPRASQLIHQQLLAAFYSVISLGCLIKAFQIKDKSPERNFFIVMFLISMILQFYTSFYLAWFSCMSLFIILIRIYFVKPERDGFLKFWNTEKWFLISCGLLGLIALLPFLYHYLKIQQEHGPRSFSEAKSMLPTFHVWFYRGADSWLYSWMSRLPFFENLQMEHEKRMGIGIVASILVFLGLKENRNKTSVRLMIYVFLVWFVCVLMLPYKKSLWGILYPVIPGSGAVRAISRIGVFFLLIYGIGIALWLDKKRQISSIASLLIVLFVCLEQGTTTESFDKIQVRNWMGEIQNAVEIMKKDKGCEAFYYMPLESPLLYYAHQVNAMWVSLKTGIPTLNGYAGLVPNGWDLAGNTDENMHLTERDLSQRIKNWIDLKKLDPRRICWIKSTG